jgi:O-acetyl-ADP-ribose deacetylase (regulator of RNase III)
MSLANTCFIISPIGQPDTPIRKEADQVLKHIIRPALEDFAIDPVRSDEISTPGAISEQMFQYILQSRLCIVLLTESNPNVFYELAVAQCAGRPTVLLIKEGNKLPFDIKDLRVIAYNLTDPDRLVEKRDANLLKGFIQSIKNSNWEATNLFTQYPYGPQLYTEKELQQKIESLRPQTLGYSNDKSYRVTDSPVCNLKIVTGSIENISNIDIIVNSENTDLQLARFYDPSVSGILRYMDAEKSAGGNITSDSLNDKLQLVIKGIGTLPVQPGTVVVTETSGLKEQGIKYVFHLALARGEIGRGYFTVADRLNAGLKNVFKELNRTQQKDATVASILFPLIGAGTAKSNPDNAAMEMINLLTDEIKKIKFNLDVYVLAWRESHRLSFQKAAKALNLTEVP